jgi:peptidoglycan/xylan/chitin deacetylase (PgdA/CDA1 family)
MSSVLVFHEITDGSWFDTLIARLKQRYRFVPLRALTECYAGGAALDHACHITVDDGDRSFYDVALPVLKKHAVPATLFVSPLMCRERKNFSFQEIRGYRQLYC